jgi:hypothetical protein
VLTQLLHHGVGVQRPTHVEQAAQRRLHRHLTLPCRQVQDVQVLLGRPGRLSLQEQVVGHAETAAGEQVAAVAVVSKRSRLAPQPVNDVPIVDAVLATPTQAGQFLHALLGVPQFHALGVQAGLQPLADQPAGHRVDVPLHADHTARFHPHAQPLARFQPRLGQRAQHGLFLGQSTCSPSVFLTEQLPQEGSVAVTSREVPVTTQHQRLVHGHLEAVMPLLHIAVFVALTGLDGLSPQPVVVQHRLITPLERLPAFLTRLHRRGQPVGAVEFGHAAQFPQGVLQAFTETLEGLGEADRARLPVGVREHEVIDHVIERHSVNGHAQVVAVAEIAGSQPTGMMHLGKENLFGRTVLCPPLLEPPLQRPQLAVGEATRVTGFQVGKEGLGLQPRVEVELLLEFGPDVVEGICACSPGMVYHGHLAGQPVELPVCPSGLAVDARLGSGQRQRHTLEQGLAQAQNLRVGNHRAPFPGEEDRWYPRVHSWGILIVASKRGGGEF